MTAPTKAWDREPSALAYMLGAFLPSPGWRGDRVGPDLWLRWNGYCVDASVRDALRDDVVSSAGSRTGTGGANDPDPLEILYPQVTGFRLVMALLTHPRWPLPIWNALQVRSRLRRLSDQRSGEPGQLSVSACGWRVLEKGVEIDVRLSQDCAGVPVWEGVTTFYYRGRYGAPASGGREHGAPATSPSLPPLAPVPDAAGSGDRAQWTAPTADRRRHGRLTGDYNGLHLWDAYARRMGFAGAFAHPQRIVAQCLARLGAPAAGARCLDLWAKGPVFYGRTVTMQHASDPATGRTTFDLRLDGEARPAIVGVLSAG